jgi:hypothetical protein
MRCKPGPIPSANQIGFQKGTTSWSPTGFFENPSSEFAKRLLEEGNLSKGTPTLMRRLQAFGLLWLLCFPGLALAQGHGEAAGELPYRKKVAAADARFAASWIAGSYDVPTRVVEELLYRGYSFAETLVAMAFMGEGYSLNEVLEQRRLRGGARWEEIARVLGLDTRRLAPPIAQLLWFGRNANPAAPVLHFMPDPRPGIIADLVIPAFEPTVPDQEAQRRFRLNRKEVENIRRVLDDPLGVSEEDMRLPAGRGLETGDWVMAGAIAYFKPFPMESLLAARVGEDLPWSEVTMAFGMRPDVLTQGPLAGIYPLVTGTGPNTILIARKRAEHPSELPLHYDLERLTPGEKRALEPLMHHYYSTSKEEQLLLSERGLGLGEQGLALALARMAQLELPLILMDYADLGSWQAIVTKYAIDMTGHPEIKAAMAVRDQAR